MNQNGKLVLGAWIGLVTALLIGRVNAQQAPRIRPFNAEIISSQTLSSAAAINSSPINVVGCENLMYTIGVSGLSAEVVTLTFETLTSASNSFDGTFQTQGQAATRTFSADETKSYIWVFPAGCEAVRMSASIDTGSCTIEVDAAGWKS